MPVEIPPQERPADDAGYLEQLTKAIFRSGFSWKVIRDKWPNFQRVFDNFDVERVAAYGDREVDRLLGDSGIVRNGRKIEATIRNAGIMSQLSAEYGSFHAYLRSLDGLDYADRRKELARRFDHLGPTGVFVFLYSVAEPVPAWEDRNR